MSSSQVIGNKSRPVKISARYIRNPPDKLSEIVTDVKTIARIASGHLLQSELVSGTVEADKLIQEVLQMGPVTFQQLMELKKETVTGARKKYEGLKTDLVSDQETKNSEEAVLLRMKHRQIGVEMADVQKMSGKDDYVKNLDTLKSIKIDDQFLPDFLSYVQTSVTNLNSLRQKDAGKIILLDINRIEYVLMILNDMENNVKKFEPIQSVINRMKSIDIRPEFMKSVESYLQEEEKFRRQPLVAVEKDKVLVNSKTLNDASDNFKTSATWAEQITELVASRQLGGYQTGNVAGLLDGAKDLMELEKVAAYEKLVAAIKGTPDTSKSIIASFAPIKPLAIELNDLETAWQKTKEAGAADKMEVTNDNIGFMGVSHDISGALEVMTACTADISKPIPTRNGVDNMKMETQKLQNDSAAVSSVDYLSKLNFDNLKADLAFKQTTNDEKLKELKAKLPSLKSKDTFKTDVDKLIKLKNELEALTSFLQSKNTSIDNLKNLISGSDSLKELTDGEFSKYLSCLAQVSDDDGNALEKMIGMIRDIRDNPISVEMSGGFLIAEAVADSQSKITSVREVGKKMKGVQNAQMNAIRILPVDSVSQLGKAALGLATIQQIKSLKSQLNGLLTMDTSVIIQDAENQKLSTDSVNFLKAMPTALQSLNATYTELEAFTTAIQNFNGVDVNSYGSVFDEAAKIKPVTMNQKQIVAALMELQLARGQSSRQTRSIDTDISEAITSLKLLAPLDLNFANYNFAAAKPALGTFQSNFLEFQKMVVAGFGNQTGLSPTTVKSAETGSWEWSIFLYIGAIIICGLFCLLWCFFPKLFPEKLRRDQLFKKMQKKQKVESVSTDGETQKNTKTAANKEEKSNSSSSVISSSSNPQSTTVTVNTASTSPSNTVSPSNGPPEEAVVPVEPNRRAPQPPSARNAKKKIEPIQSLRRNRAPEQAVNQVQQVDNVASQPRRANNMAPQPSNRAPQPSNRVPQPSNRAPQPSNRAPQRNPIMHPVNVQEPPPQQQQMNVGEEEENAVQPDNRQEPQVNARTRPAVRLPRQEEFMESQSDDHTMLGVKEIE